MSTATVTDKYVLAVAAEVRAWMARRDLRGHEVGEYLGHDDMWVSRRVRGRVAWTGAELLRLAGLFRCEPKDLLPHLDSNQKPFDFQLSTAIDVPEIPEQMAVVLPFRLRPQVVPANEEKAS